MCLTSHGWLLAKCPLSEAGAKLVEELQNVLVEHVQPEHAAMQTNIQSH